MARSHQLQETLASVSGLATRSGREKPLGGGVMSRSSGKHLALCFLGGAHAVFFLVANGCRAFYFSTRR
jgi:hypothetical protein